MLNLKKTALAVLAFGSSAAFAGTMGPACVPGNVTVPCESCGWEIGIAALYLKPALSNDMGWLGVTVGSGGTSVTFLENDPRWTWGFMLEGAYHFSTGNDFNLNWYHLGRKSTTRSFTSSFTLLDIGSISTSETARIRPRWDAVNLEFGQLSNFGDFKRIRFHGGFQYASIKSNLYRTGSDVITDTDETFSHSVTVNSKFNGFGARVGVDMNYNWGNGLYMFGNGASAILVGSSKFSNSYVDSLVETVDLYVSGSKTTLVPELEVKVGLGYGFPLAQGDFAIDVGYMWVNYFNPLLYGGLFESVGASDFSVHGPFLGIKWEGNVV